MASEQSSAAVYQEIEDWPRDCGVADIKSAELRALAGSIKTIVNAETGASVSAVYVVGSFARGEARRVASDLDLRIVTRSPLPESEAEPCEKTLKHEHGSDICPSACGYLDPHITVLEPGDETPNVEITT